MRWITRVVLWLLVITTSRAADDEEMLRNAMEHMLQIRPPRDLHPEDTSNEESAAPNLYMIELYKKYLTSDSMKTRSNTIRSIIPQRGRVGSGEEMLLFNLSGLSGSEEISSAELHFYKRRAISSRKSKLLLPNHHHFLQGFLLMGSDDDTDENTPQSHSSKDPERIGHWEVALEKRGWQVYDVSSAFQRRQPLMRQLGFNFLGASKRRPILPLETVMRMDPTPFLVIYSNERSNASLAAPQDLNALPDENDLAQKENRQRRSIDDNELPEADHHQNGGQYVNSNVIPLTSPGVLQGRGRTGAGGKISGQGKTATAGSSSSSRSSSSSSSSTLPYPKAGSTLDWPTEDKGTGKKTTRTSAAAGSSSTSGSRKGKRRNRKLPETWHYNQQQHVNDARLDVPEDAGRSLCQRRKLTVDFHEIGWGEWIISPKTFEAQYCAGRCPFPLTKELNPTNHATIQSIVHAIGGHPEVPAPCCVPDVLSSLTLLYFDDNRNVVLKNYPSMTAESCACR